MPVLVTLTPSGAASRVAVRLLTGHGAGVYLHFATLAFQVPRELSAPHADTDSPLVVFFPTQKETFLGFVIQGPYRTTPARDNVPEHDPSNQALVRETAVLLGDVLRELRSGGLLTVGVLEALPLDVTRFQPGTMFRPLFESVRAALGREDFI